MIPHGVVECSRCWKDVHGAVQERGKYRLVRDPGHWGSSNPTTLVLGISKGNTQSRAFRDGDFDRVAFKEIRPRMLECLQSIGLLPGETPDRFNQRFTRGETDFAFASVIRCSLTGFDQKKGCHSADSPNVIPAFKHGDEGSYFVENCVEQHLVHLPSRTSLVLLLGNTDAYIRNFARILHRLRGGVKSINPVAYVSKGVWFIHVTHPSKLNGHFGSYVRGEGTAGLKRQLAREALETFRASFGEEL